MHSPAEGTKLLPSPGGNSHVPSLLSTPAASNYSCLWLPHSSGDDLLLAGTPFPFFFVFLLSRFFLTAGLSKSILRKPGPYSLIVLDVFVFFPPLFCSTLCPSQESESGGYLFAESRLIPRVEQCLPIHQVSNIFQMLIIEKLYILANKECGLCCGAPQGVISFWEGNCLWSMLGSIQGTFEGITFTCSWHCACRKGHLPSRNMHVVTCGQGVCQIWGFVNCYRNAMGYTPKHKGTASLEGRQSAFFSGTSGKNAGRMATFSSSSLSIAISTLMQCLNFCQAITSAWWRSLRVKHHFSFLVHQNK